MDKVKCSFCDGKGYVKVYNNLVDRIIIEEDCPECNGNGYYVGSDVVEILEISDEELEGLDEFERNKIISEYYETWKNEQLEQYWEEVKE